MHARRTGPVILLVLLAACGASNAGDAGVKRLPNPIAPFVPPFPRGTNPRVPEIVFEIPSPRDWGLNVRSLLFAEGSTVSLYASGTLFPSTFLPDWPQPPDSTLRIVPLDGDGEVSVVDSHVEATWSGPAVVLMEAVEGHELVQWWFVQSLKPDTLRVWSADWCSRLAADGSVLLPRQHFQLNTDLVMSVDAGTAAPAEVVLAGRPALVSQSFGLHDGGLVA